MNSSIIDLKNSGVSVVIGSYNRKKFLKKTIITVRKELDSCSFPSEIIVVDGGSTDGTLSWLVKQKDIITIVQHNRGVWRGQPIERRSWGYFMNLGFKSAKGKYICMISDDCLVIPGAIVNGYYLFEERLNAEEKIGAVAFYWRDWPEQERYRVGLTLGNKMFVNHGMYLKSILDDVGYIDEETCMFYHADGDLCLKIWQSGNLVVDSPNSYIEHYSHANTKVRRSNNIKEKQDRENYINKWDGVFFPKSLDDIGSWFEKEFIDSKDTAKRELRIIHALNVWSHLKKIRLKFRDLFQ